MHAKDVLKEFIAIEKLEKKLIKYALEQFHARHKYLYFTYNQSLKSKLGQIVGNHDKMPIGDLLSEYKDCLKALLSRRPTKANKINAFDHIYGYFKREVTDEEKAIYLKYRKDFMSGLDVEQDVIAYLIGLANKYNNPYIAKQSILSPSSVKKGG